MDSNEKSGQHARTGMQYKQRDGNSKKESSGNTRNQKML